VFVAVLNLPLSGFQLALARGQTNFGFFARPCLEDQPMLKLRTKLLLFAIAVFGVGIGLLSSLADGAYSAICLFVLPVLVALAGASIISDFNREPVAQTETTVTPAAQPKETGRSARASAYPRAAFRH
jgi:hypothetical protein